MKICSKCNIKKDIEFFYKRKDSKDGLRADCKECFNIGNKNYCTKNKDRVKEYKNIYYNSNKELIVNRSKQWAIDNPISFKEKIKRYSNKESTKNKRKQHYLDNKEFYSIRNKEYKLLNKDKLNNSHKIKYNSDILYRLKFLLRGIISKSFKRKGFGKFSKTSEILGCSFEEFQLYLESKFEDWMNWNNRGLYNGELNYGWDIDHIIPLSSAKTEEEMILLNHYSNLQPLCSKINRDIKRDNIWNYFTLI